MTRCIHKMPCCVERGSTLNSSHSSQLKKIDFYLSNWLANDLYGDCRWVQTKKNFCRHFSKETMRVKNILYENDLFSLSNCALHKLHSTRSCGIIIMILKNFNVSSCSSVEGMDSKREDKVVRKQCQLSSNAVPCYKKI